MLYNVNTSLFAACRPRGVGAAGNFGPGDARSKREHGKERKGGRRVDIRYCKLEIFLPESHLEAVRRALERVDAGHIGRYDRCLSYSPVTSCWRPLPGTSPYLGEVGAVCTARELKVEVTCPVERVEETVAAVRAAHPYEEPVIQVIPLWGTGLAGEQKEGDSHGI